MPTGKENQLKEIQMSKCKVKLEEIEIDGKFEGCELSILKDGETLANYFIAANDENMQLAKGIIRGNPTQEKLGYPHADIEWDQTSVIKKPKNVKAKNQKGKN